MIFLVGILCACLIAAIVTMAVLSDKLHETQRLLDEAIATAVEAHTGCLRASGDMEQAAAFMNRIEAVTRLQPVIGSSNRRTSDEEKEHIDSEESA